MSYANIFFEIPLTRSASVNIFRAFWWALSLVGRAPHLQCGGHRFESGRVHQIEFWAKKSVGDSACSPDVQNNIDKSAPSATIVTVLHSPLVFVLGYPRPPLRTRANLSRDSLTLY